MERSPGRCVGDPLFMGNATPPLTGLLEEPHCWFQYKTYSASSVPR